MIYFDELNNAELFATYALAKPAAWTLVIERLITHRLYGNGTIKEKDGLIFRIQFPDELRYFCELDFFSSDFAKAQFTNIDLPLNLDRDYLIDTLYWWEIRQKRRSYSGPQKNYRRCVCQAEWLYQQSLVKREYMKVQEQKERAIRDAKCAVSPTTHSARYKNYYDQTYDERDEM